MNEFSQRYRVRHRTVYKYTGSIDLCHNLLHLAPRDDTGAEIEHHALTIDPKPDSLTKRTDYLGNPVQHLSLHRSHQKLEILAETIVVTAPAPSIDPALDTPWDALSIHPSETDPTGILFGEFLFPTVTCPFLPAVREFTVPSLVPGRGTLEVAADVMSRIHREFTFKSGVTRTTTTLAEIAEKKVGVCQDFSHFMLAALRSAGIPARYVSGYLETVPPPGKKRLVGADASHAWVEVWSPRIGWIGFDPTNDKRPGARHVKICHGRDYFDVQPVRGIFVGTGTQTLSVAVDVQPVEGDPSTPPPPLPPA